MGPSRTARARGMSDTAERSASSSYVRRRTPSPDSCSISTPSEPRCRKPRDTDVKWSRRPPRPALGRCCMREDAAFVPALTSTVHSAHPTTAQRGFKLVVKMQDGQLVETVAIVPGRGGSCGGRHHRVRELPGRLQDGLHLARRARYYAPTLQPARLSSRCAWSARRQALRALARVECGLHGDGRTTHHKPVMARCAR